jgi:hypothetical protein
MRRGRSLGATAAVTCSVVALALAGCGSDDAEAEFPQGTWSYNDPAAGRGERILDFRPDGTYVASDAFETEQLRSTYAAKDGTLVLEGDPVRGDVQGTYRWSLRDDQLVLRAESDDCAERRISLDGTSLTAVE